MKASYTATRNGVAKDDVFFFIGNPAMCENDVPVHSKLIQAATGQIQNKVLPKDGSAQLGAVAIVSTIYRNKETSDKFLVEYPHTSPEPVATSGAPPVMSSNELNNTGAAALDKSQQQQHGKRPGGFSLVPGIVDLDNAAAIEREFESVAAPPYKIPKLRYVSFLPSFTMTQFSCLALATALQPQCTTVPTGTKVALSNTPSTL